MFNVASISLFFFMLFLIVYDLIADSMGNNRFLEVLIHKFSKGIFAILFTILFISHFIKENGGDLVNVPANMGMAFPKIDFLYVLGFSSFITVIMYVTSYMASRIVLPVIIKNESEIKGSRLFGYLLAPVISIIVVITYL